MAEYIQPVLESLEDQDATMEGIQVTINGRLETITADQQEAYQELVRQGGMLTDLNTNQQQLIEQMGGTETLLTSVANNVSELRIGLETAREEREAGFAEAATERQQIAQSLNDKLDQQAQGQTVELNAAESRLLASQIQGDERLIQEFSTRAGALEEYIASQGTTLSNAQEQIRQQQEQQYQELTAGQQQAAQDRIRIEQSTNNKLEQLRQGIAVEFTDAEARRVEEITGLEARLLQDSAANAEEFARLLESEGQRFDDITNVLSSDIERLQQQTGEFESRAEERFDEAAQERLRLAQSLADANNRLENLSEADRERYEELDLTVDTLEEEFGVNFDRIEETQDILQTYAEEEFGAVREDIAGLEERMDANAVQQLAQLTGFRTEFLETLSASEAAAFARNQGLSDQITEEITGIRGETAAQVAGMGQRLTDRIDAYEQQTGEQLDIATEERAVLSGQITGLETRIDANAIQQLSELTGLRSEFLATLTASEAAAIARNQGLSEQLTEEITGVRGETAAQIEGINERLTNRINEFEQQTGQELDIATEERAVLGGQLGTLTADVAQVAEDLIRADGRIEDLDAAGRQRYEDLNMSIDDVSLRIGVDINALREGMLTQESAMRELVEETSQQTEETLTNRLEEAEQGFATSLSDTEANLLSQITGVEAGVLQQLATVEGGLQQQFGEQFGQVQQQVSGLGEQVSGLGEGLAGLGQGVAGLGVGLLGGLMGLGQQQEQIITQLSKPEVIEFDPFLKGLSPFQPMTPVSLAPQKQTDAMSELNKFMGRQTGMLV